MVKADQFWKFLDGDFSGDFGIKLKISQRWNPRDRQKRMSVGVKSFRLHPAAIFFLMNRTVSRQRVMPPLRHICPALSFSQVKFFGQVRQEARASGGAHFLRRNIRSRMASISFFINDVSSPLAMASSIRF